MTHPAGGALATDFELMAAVAGQIDTGNEEIRAMLTALANQMTNVSPVVWGGAAAARFGEVMARWNTESARLYAALQQIAETLRGNEQTLRQAADDHAVRIAAAGSAF